MGVFAQDGLPLFPGLEADNGDAQVFHGLLLDLVTLLALGEFVMRAVDVNSHLLLGIEEVRLGLALLDEMLSVAWQRITMIVQVVEPLFFEV